MFLRYAVFFLVMCLPNMALAEARSEYSKFDIETDCKQWGPFEEAGGSGTLICPGYDGLNIVLSFGDLRESISVHATLSEDLETPWQSFSAWNSVNPVFEFRLLNGIPRATIHRVFLDNVNPDTGSADASFKGQILVVTTIALNPGEPSCMAGVVDARANKNANLLARQVADTVAVNFECGADQPVYHGERGRYASSLSISN